jgi:hypothetical protein
LSEVTLDYKHKKRKEGAPFMFVKSNHVR